MDNDLPCKDGVCLTFQDVCLVYDHGPEASKVHRLVSDGDDQTESTATYATYITGRWKGGTVGRKKAQATADGASFRKRLFDFPLPASVGRLDSFSANATAAADE